MRRYLSIISAALVLFTTTGCLKDTPSTDLTHLGTVIEMMYPNGGEFNGVGTGLEFFGGDIITTEPGQFNFQDGADTVWYYANLAGPSLINKPVAVTMAVDDSALQDNVANDGLTYLPLPDSCYKMVQTSGNIPANQRVDTFAVVIYSNKIDLTQNYGLPIQLQAPGYTVASNFSIMYLHTVGAPIGGIYDLGTTIQADSTVAGTPQDMGPTVFTPLDNSDIEVVSGDTTGISYIISFTNNGGVAVQNSATVTIDPNTLPKNAAIFEGPKVISQDETHNKYTIQMVVTYNSGAYYRYITDTYTFISKS